MSPFDPNNFLESMRRFAAAAVTPALSLVAPVEMWRTQANEGVAGASAELYTVVRYGTGTRQEWEAVIKRSLQWLTVGPAKAPETVAARAQKVFETLLNSEGRPLQMKTINGFKASDGNADGTWQLKNIVFIQTPSLIGVDDKGRHNWAFNTDIDLCKLS